MRTQEIYRNLLLIIIYSNVDYEFRTTVVPKFYSVDDIKQIAKLIDGANCFVFYEFVLDYAINQDLSMKWSPFDISNEKYAV